MARIIGIIGSYRKEGMIAQAVEEVLEAAKEGGAEVETVFLEDEDVKFCTNCRCCTQEPGEKRGVCVKDDQMSDILNRIEECDGIVIGSPVNFGTVNALTKRFVERLICYAYWPWGERAPVLRNKSKKRKAVVVTSSAMPAFVARFLTNAAKVMRSAADTLGAKTVETVYIGSCAVSEKGSLNNNQSTLARKAGWKLVKSLIKEH